MSFDILTLFLVVIMASFVLGGALALVGFRQDKVLMIWSAALIVHGVVYSLFLLRGQISDLLSVVVANVLLSVVFSMFVLGLAHFYRLRLPAVWLAAFSVVTALCFILFFDNMNARIVTGALIYCVQTGLGLWLIARHYRDTPGRGQFIVMSGYLVVLSVLLARVLAVGGGYIEIPSIFSETQLQQLSFLGVILALLLLSSGLVLMVQERSAAALLASRERLAKQNVALRRSARELEEANAKLESLSNTDPLTGLFNRRYFDRQLAIEGARAQRHDHSFAVIMIDIDYFKKFNDRYGHPAGDACLIKVAAALQAGLRRAGDLLARLGGEEFVVILSETDATALATLANQLRRQVHDLRLRHEDSPEEVVTLSLGAALAESLQGIDPAFVLQRADEALYAAKQGGRNRVVVFSAGCGAAQENAA